MPRETGIDNVHATDPQANAVEKSCRPKKTARAECARGSRVTYEVGVFVRGNWRMVDHRGIMSVSSSDVGYRALRGCAWRRPQRQRCTACWRRGLAALGIEKVCVSDRCLGLGRDE